MGRLFCWKLSKYGSKYFLMERQIKIWLKEYLRDGLHLFLTKIINE